MKSLLQFLFIKLDKYVYRNANNSISFHTTVIITGDIQADGIPFSLPTHFPLLGKVL